MTIVRKSFFFQFKETEITRTQMGDLGCSVRYFSQTCLNLHLGSRVGLCKDSLDTKALLSQLGIKTPEWSLLSRNMTGAPHSLHTQKLPDTYRQVGLEQCPKAHPFQQDSLGTHKQL
jgi:hypothetical protein